MIEERIVGVLREAVSAAQVLAPGDDPPEIELTKPKKKEHGDFATNLALQIARRAERPPREIAEAIVARLPAAPFVERVEVAGPGFINLFVADDWLHDVLRDVVAKGAGFGREEPSGRSVQVEFLSANPTGPLHIGHARNAVIGDAIASVLDAGGWRVEREYYFNDAGRQMELFGASVEARYLELFGRDAEIPEDGYHGAYLIDIAKDIRAAVGDTLLALPPEERKARLLHEGAERVLAMTHRTLDRFGVRFDAFFSERTLHERGEIDQAVARLRDAGTPTKRTGPCSSARPRSATTRTGCWCGPTALHVLRRRLRLPDRQVLTWIRPSRVRVGGRPSRRRRPRSGRRASARLRSDRRRDRAVPVGVAHPGGQGGRDEQTRRNVRDARRAAR